MSDQDILNTLYGKRILPLEDAIWNYDARNYGNYMLRSGGAYDMPWVMQHTAILHFCGKENPGSPGISIALASCTSIICSLRGRHGGAQPKRGLATYGQIKDYVLEHSGLKVSSFYIAQVKQKHGTIERENYNKTKSEDARQPQCPPERETAITEALQHFRMI